MPAFRRMAYMEPQAGQTPQRKAYMEPEATAAVWRAPSRQMLLGGLVGVQGICFRSWPIG